MDFYTFLPKILNMSLTASVAIVFVLLLRLLLKKAPKVISYALWGVVLIRLLCPVSIESGLSLFGLFDTPTAHMTERTSAVEYIPSNIVHTEYPEVVLPVPGIGEAITEALPQGEEQLRADPMEAPMSIATYVWMGGILVMATYGIVTYLRLRRKLQTASPLRENIWLADGIESPFVMGLIRPKIYLPSAMEEREQSYIILHEQHHIRRLDHIVKALAFVALCIHWFNPLVWVAFILSGKDMEMSCDEAVVRKLGTEIRADYSASLLSLATGKRIIAGMPLAFGEGNTKGRIRNLANWKKPAFWVVLVAVIACVVLAVCLLTNPADDEMNAPEPFGHSYRVAEILHDAPQFSFTYTVETAPRYQFPNDYGMLVSGDVMDTLGSDSWMRVQGACEEVKITTENFDNYFDMNGWLVNNAVWSEFRSTIKKAWRIDVQDDKDGAFYYFMQTNSGEVYLSYGYDKGKEPLIRWLFRLERTDLISCNAISEDCDAYVEPAFYPEGFDWDYDSLPAGLINNEGTLVFNVEWKTDTLRVGEDYYRKTGEDSTFVERNTFELSRNADGKFELDVSRKGETQEHAFYFIEGEAGKYVFKITFNNTSAPLVETSLNEIIPGTTYVSWQCLYMNPLSSFAAMGGDSGCKYVVGDDYFAIYRRSNGDVISITTNPGLERPDTAGSNLQSMVDVPNWEWQPFPYTDEEWAALYQPGGFGGMQNIHELYDEILYQPLVDGQFLLRVDGDLWIVELRSNPQMGTYLWSIYSLVPEAAMGVAQWQFAPQYSSRYPVFRFEFDLDYDEISAVCTESKLVDFNGTNEAGSNMMVPAGKCLYWSPVNENGATVSDADIHFSVHKDGIMIYAGTIYVESSGGMNHGHPVYTASLVGTGLHLSPNTETEGGVISAVNASVGSTSLVTEHDLRNGGLEVDVEDLDQYVFFTNSTKIAIEVEGEADFDGEIVLHDISQSGDGIQFAKVNTKDNEALFSNLTSARMYRLSCEGLDGCKLVITEK